MKNWTRREMLKIDVDVVVNCKEKINEWKKNTE